MAAGALGVPLGSALAQRLRRSLPDCDPVICGMALLASAPLVFLALATVHRAGSLAYFLVFLGMLTCNLTWSIVADIVLVSAVRSDEKATDTRPRLARRTTNDPRTTCYDSSSGMTHYYPPTPNQRWAKRFMINVLRLRLQLRLAILLRKVSIGPSDVIAILINFVSLFL